MGSDVPLLLRIFLLFTYSAAQDYFLGISDIQSKEYCLNEYFHAKCNSSRMVLIESAQYGRMRRGRCLDKASENLDCYADVTSLLDRVCARKEECNFSVVAYLFNVQTSCDDDTLKYLEASYQCIEVQEGDNSTCQTAGYTTVTSLYGFLSRNASSSSIYGTSQCPWRIAAERGQQIRFVLYDFSIQDMPSLRGAGANTNTRCSADIVIQDGVSSPTTHNLCNGRSRKRYFATSRGHMVDVYFRFSGSDAVPFLLSYEAIGCPYFEPPANMTLVIEGDLASVECNFTGETWYLTCQGHTWEGDLGNCTKPPPVKKPPNQGGGTLGFQWAILAAVGIGILVGAAVGLSLLGLVFLIRKCFFTPKKKPQKGLRTSIHKDIPAMTDIISEATAMAKRPGSSSGSPQMSGHMRYPSQGQGQVLVPAHLRVPVRRQSSHSSDATSSTTLTSATIEYRRKDNTRGESEDIEPIYETTCGVIESISKKEPHYFDMKGKPMTNVPAEITELSGGVGNPVTAEESLTVTAAVVQEGIAAL